MTEQPTQQALTGPGGEKSPATSTPSAAVAVLQRMKTLLNASGEMELGNLQIGERVQKFLEFRESSQCNLPLWETAILSQFPPGTTLVPIPIIPTLGDAWRDADAKKMGLKEGHVEPKADFLIKLGNISGIYYNKVEEGEVDGIYKCRYDAFMTLPNGELLTIQSEGKDQDAFNNDGSKKAHVAESTRKKAKRNVVKNMLGIPTSMPAAEFDRPWILLKPVFRAGDPETNRIIAEQKQLASKAKAALFGDGPVVDVQTEPTANKDGEVTAEGMKARVRAASSLQELESIKGALASMSMTTEERKVLGALVIGKEDELKAGEVKL